MKGLFVPIEKIEEYKEIVSASGNVPIEVVRNFGNAVLLYESDERLALTKLFHANGDDEHAKVFANDEAELIRSLAEPKPKNMGEADYARLYRGYDWLEDQKIIADRCSKAAHKAWTTTRFWESQVLAGLFTHEVIVAYAVAGQSYTHSDVAVSETHGRSVAKKAIKKLARDLYPDDFVKRNGRKDCPFKARIAGLGAEVKIAPISEAR